MIRALAFLVLLASPALAADLPNPALTPGEIRDGVTAADLCPVAHTKALRHVTAAMKRQAYASYGMRGNHTGYCKGKQGCEVDHLCSLENGGTNSIKNLWPQRYADDRKCHPGDRTADCKDLLENEMHRRICSGELTPQQACDALATDWVAAYRQYLGQP